jgi:hypothetical protein
MQNNCRIFKLFGNHEIGNMSSDPYYEKFKYDYIFPNDIDKDNYYRDDTIINTFLRGKNGYNELMKDGCVCLLIINNYIFVNCELIKDNIDRYINYNNKLNNPNTSSKEYDEILQYLG